MSKLFNVDPVGMRVIVRSKRPETRWADNMYGIVKTLTPNTLIVDIIDSNHLRPPYGLVTCLDDEIEFLKEPEEQKEDVSDPVNHPSHYTSGKYEAIEYLEARGYGFNAYLFNAVKYIVRAGKKDPDKEDEDLDKAVWYLNRLLHEMCDYLRDFANEHIGWRIIEPTTEQFLEDQGLTNTPRGFALELIENGEYELAIEMLTIFRDARAKNMPHNEETAS